MENFKKAFIRTATRYAEYVEAKIISPAEIKIKLPEKDKSKGGTVYVGHKEPTVSEQICEEIRTLNAVATAAGKLKETTEIEINLTETELKENVLAPEQEEKLKKKILFAINKDKETGEIEICPMNERKCITLHGAEEVKWFINQLIKRMFLYSMEKEEDTGRGAAYGENGKREQGI